MAILAPDEAPGLLAAVDGDLEHMAETMLLSRAGHDWMGQSSASAAAYNVIALLPTPSRSVWRRVFVPARLAAQSHIRCSHLGDRGGLLEVDMAKKPRQTGKQRSPRSRPWLWPVAGGGLLVIAAALLWSQTVGHAPGTSVPQVEGSPRLAMDRTTVDEGRVGFGVPVQTTFRLSNVGDQPLQILGEPEVELVVGC